MVGSPGLITRCVAFFFPINYQCFWGIYFSCPGNTGTHQLCTEQIQNALFFESADKHILFSLTF